MTISLCVIPIGTAPLEVSGVLSIGESSVGCPTFDISVNIINTLLILIIVGLRELTVCRSSNSTMFVGISFVGTRFCGCGDSGSVL
jgi:hypothetical protein